jgi:hypothetical protein
MSLTNQTSGVDKMKINIKFSALFLVLLGALLVLPGVSALQANFFEVELDGVRLSESNENSITAFERNDEFELMVIFALNGSDGETFDNVQVEARIRGYEFNDIIGDISNAFNVYANTNHYKRLNIKLPVRMESSSYKLRVTVTDAFGEEVSKTYDLKIIQQESGIWIRELMLNPDNSVQAGRALLASVRLRNIGERDERHGVRVKVSIPGLEVAATDYIDEIRVDETITSEELYLRIPSCAKPGVYDVLLEVTYKDGDKQLTASRQIEVAEGEFCETTTTPEKPVEDKTPIITSGAEVQNVMAGVGGAVYPISITNRGDVAQTFTVLVDTESWATVRVSPSNVMIIQPGKTETAYVYLSANKDALEGQNLFAVSVKYGQSMEQFMLVANVVPSENGDLNNNVSLKNILEIGLVVLVLLLVILGLIIGFRKMKKEDNDNDEEQSYY